jgi:hypothetical protein
VRARNRFSREGNTAQSVAALFAILCLLGAPALAEDTKTSPAGGNAQQGTGEKPKAPVPGKLSPEDEGLLKCATSDELLLIQSLQRSVEGFRREMDALDKPYMDANDAAWSAQEHVDQLWAEGSTATDEEKQAAGAEAIRLRKEARRIWDGVKKRDGELEANITAADKELRELIAKIRARGCPPPAAGKVVKPGPGLPVPHEAFVMPVLPECFDEEKDRSAFDDKVYELFLEQINASSLGSTEAVRADARRNVDALAALRARIFLVPLCALKDVGKAPHTHGKPDKKKGRKRHAKRGLTEDSPFYMENAPTYHASRGSSHRSTDDDQSNSPPYSPPSGEDTNTTPSREPNLPTPPDSVPGIPN